MTLYRLNLTGEYEGRILADCVNVRLQLPDGGSVTVPVELAAEVKPPLPVEPPPGAVVLDRDGDAWQVHEIDARTNRPGGADWRTEVLWSNRPLGVQPALFEVGAEHPQEVTR